MAHGGDAAEVRLDGSILVYLMFDVGEEIDLEALRERQRLEAPGREPKFRHPVPGYVRFEHPPLVEGGPEVALAGGERFASRVKYFRYGVVSVEMQSGFAGATWEELARRVGALMDRAEVESAARALARERVEQCGGAVVKPYGEWLSEDYLVVQIAGVRGRAMTGAELLSEYGGQVSQLVRGEQAALSESERREVLQANVSYYPSDLLVVSWSAALAYDEAEAAGPTLQLLEYANSQLLEFRHYDETLRGVLAELYKVLEHRGGLVRRWRMAREAARLNTIRLDVRELAERSEHAIRFLSDMFYARVYRLAAEKIGVTDYRASVDDKLRVADELYQFIVGEFHHGRAFVLEAMVVLILIIDLVYLFGGKG